MKRIFSFILFVGILFISSCDENSPENLDNENSPNLRAVAEKNTPNGGCPACAIRPEIFKSTTYLTVGDSYTISLSGDNVVWYCPKYGNILGKKITVKFPVPGTYLVEAAVQERVGGTFTSDGYIDCYCTVSYHQDTFIVSVIQ